MLNQYWVVPSPPPSIPFYLLRTKPVWVVLQFYRQASDENGHHRQAPAITATVTRTTATVITVIITVIVPLLPLRLLPIQELGRNIFPHFSPKYNDTSHWRCSCPRTMPKEPLCRQGSLPPQIMDECWFCVRPFSHAFGPVGSGLAPSLFNSFEYSIRCCGF